MSELSDLRKNWTVAGDTWDEESSLAFAQRAISLSDAQLAIKILKAAEIRFTSDSDIKYRLALAYANSGSKREVFKYLDELITAIGTDDRNYVDAKCLMGRLQKDQFIRDPDSAEGQKALLGALEAYNLAYEFSGNAFPGINAATLFFLAGEVETARNLAHELIKNNAKDQKEIWHFATLAEAHLLREEFDEAFEHYKKVAELCGKDYGSLNSVRKHILLIAEKMKVPKRLSTLLAGPVICVFSGHMFDTKDRESPRFPMELGAAVADEIGMVIDKEGINIGYCSAANGGDILFAKEMIKRNLEVNIVIPFDRDVFRTASVVRGGIDQSQEYWEVLRDASSVTVATEESYLGNPCLFSYAADLIEGYAQLRADEFGGKVIMLAAIDPYETGLSGGSVELSQEWLDMGMDVSIVDIAELRGAPPGKAMLQTSELLHDKRRLDREIKSVVEVVTNAGDKAELVWALFKGRIPNSWQDTMEGGGANRAFNVVKDAAEYAYRLRAEAGLVNWQEHGLPLDTEIQIAVHTGPVFARKSNQAEYYGSHVFHARDMATVAPAGCIYLTEQAAALLATHGPESYSADYIGELEVNLKRKAVYRLHRA